jgi:hypothetical protein
MMREKERAGCIGRSQQFPGRGWFTESMKGNIKKGGETKW